MLRIAHRTRRRSGHTVVEVALMINVLLLFILGVFEYGRFLMIKQLMDNAAREGGRYAVVSTNTSPATTTAQVQTVVSGYLAGSIPTPTISIYQADPVTGNNVGVWSATPFGGVIAVQIDASYVPVFPATLKIIPSPISLTAKCVVRSEAN